MRRPSPASLPASSPGAQGPPSEAEFIRALRDRVLGSVDLRDTAGVPGLTPTEIEADSGLSRPSVTALVRRFEPVLEAQDADGNRIGGSDQARRWALDPRVGIAIGIAIGGGDHGWVGRSDLYGRISPAPLQLDGLGSPDQTLDQAVRQVRQLLGDRPLTDVVGVGVSLAAPVEREKGLTRVVHPPATAALEDTPWADWQLMRVREHLRARLGWEDVTFQLDNDANLSAWAEYIWGAARPSRLGDRRPYRNVVYLEWSRGIGAGLIVGGQLYRGEGVAGEIGHTVLGDHTRPCKRCGNTGCLETVAGWDAVLRRLEPFKDREQLREDDLKTALRLAAQPGSDAAEAFAAAATDVGRVLGPTIHTLNPQLVVIGGDIGRLGYEVVKTPLLQSIRRHTMRPALADVTIVHSILPDHPALRGALALMLRPPREDPNALLAFLQRKIREPRLREPRA